MHPAALELSVLVHSLVGNLALAVYTSVCSTVNYSPVVQVLHGSPDATTLLLRASQPSFSGGWGRSQLSPTRLDGVDVIVAVLSCQHSGLQGSVWQAIACLQSCLDPGRKCALATACTQAASQQTEMHTSHSRGAPNKLR